MDKPARQLVIMAKQPAPGLVKTRLIPALGAHGATRLYEAMLLDVVHGMTNANLGTVTVAVHPAPAMTDMRRLFRDVPHMAQEGGSLGERMVSVFDHLLASGPAVVMRNSDSPDLPAARVIETFDALESGSVDVVFGPDLGGGYYLVGLTRPWPGMFNLPMSTGSNLETTLDWCRREGLRTRILGEHADIDTPDDLRRFAAQGCHDLCPNTIRVLRELGVAG